MGFNVNLMYFICSKLKYRTQHVELKSFYTYSGAHQINKHAPLIFSLFVSDICKNITSNVLLFADNLNIFRVIHQLTDYQIPERNRKVIERWYEN